MLINDNKYINTFFCPYDSNNLLMASISNIENKQIKIQISLYNNNIQWIRKLEVQNRKTNMIVSTWRYEEVTPQNENR